MSHSDLNHKLDTLNNRVSHCDERWEMVTAQTLQRVDHSSNRLRVSVEKLESKVMDLENYISKTTDFQVRSHRTS